MITKIKNFVKSLTPVQWTLAAIVVAAVVIFGKGCNKASQEVSVKAEAPVQSDAKK